MGTGPLTGDRVALAAMFVLGLIGVSSALGSIFMTTMGKEVQPTLAAVALLAVREIVNVLNTYTRGQGDSANATVAVRGEVPADPGMGV